MIDKEHLWSELTRKNPRLLKDPHFTTAGLRKFFDMAYEAGRLSSKAAHNDGRELFDVFFGGKL
jgi:hypothetical protein